MIESTVKKISEGSGMVSRTNEAFTEVTSAVTKVGELVSEISAASNEQAQGIEQVNAAVNDMDKVTQQNAANAEESASAAEEMNAQAEDMKRWVEKLEIVAHGGGNRHRFHGDTQAANKPNYAKVPKLRQLQNAPAKRELVRPEVTPAEVVPFDEDDFSEF